MRFARLIPTAVALAFLGGCAQTFDATSTGVPVTMASGAGAVPAGEKFTVTTHAVYAFWGLVPLSPPRLGKVLESQLVGATQVAQVRIRSRMRWSDLLFTGLTLGVFSPRTVTYEGIVVK